MFPNNLYFKGDSKMRDKECIREVVGKELDYKYTLGEDLSELHNEYFVILD